jgi:hypothetical protein
MSHKGSPHHSLILGQPRRHLLTTGWSVFVSSKRLVAGDAFIFLRYAGEHLEGLKPFNTFCLFAFVSWVCGVQDEYSISLLLL